MMAVVSAAASVSESASGLPDPDGHPWGWHTRVMSGSAGRPGPYLFGAPQPDGHHRRTGGGGQAGRARLAMEFGIEEGPTTGDRALREHDRPLRPPSGRPRPRAGAGRTRCPGRPGSRRARGRRIPTTGASKISFLPRKRTGRPSWRPRGPARPHRSSCGGWRPTGPDPARDVVDALDVEAGVGEGRRAGRTVAPGGTAPGRASSAPRGDGPNARRASGGPPRRPLRPGSGLTAWGQPTLTASGRSKMLSLQAWQSARSMSSAPGPRPHGAQLARPPDEPLVEAPGIAPVLVS